MIVLVTLISVLSNAFLVRYLLIEREKTALNKVYEELEQGADITGLEQAYNAAILHFSHPENAELFNEEFREAMSGKNIGYTKLWLWEKDFEKLENQGNLTRVYSQGWLHYSIMVKYVFDSTGVWAIVMNLPDTAQTVSLVNQSNLLVFSAGGLVIILMVILLIRRITAPLSELSEAAEGIGRSEFRQITLDTGDEIEDLSKSFNEMSLQLEKNQNRLLEKNQDMEELLASVAHEIKTPAALIKAYVSGMRDQMDDGTFLETISEQADQISELTDTLLFLSRVRTEASEKVCFSLSEAVKKTAEVVSILAEERNLEIRRDIEPGIMVVADVENTVTVLRNIMTNAAKYGVSFMAMTLKKTGEEACFKIINDVAADTVLETSRLWETFYVGEASRSKNLSGTGLGLAVVRSILEQQQLSYGCYIEENNICFYVCWPLDGRGMETEK